MFSQCFYNFISFILYFCRPGILKGIHKKFIMYQLLSATQYLHSGNVIHRDQKPSNILLDTECNCKIADFGLATVLSHSEEKLKLRCGSPGYVSPELLRNEGYSCSADIFSAGVIFYVILTGRPLFKGQDQN